MRGVSLPTLWKDVESTRESTVSSLYDMTSASSSLASASINAFDCWLRMLERGKRCIGAPVRLGRGISLAQYPSV